MFKSECEELARMANDHTVESCVTGWFDNRPVKNTKTINITKRLTVFTEEAEDIEAVPYLLANRIRSYQRAVVNPMIDALRLSAIASAANIRSDSTANLDYVVPALSEQLEAAHRQIGNKPLVTFLNSRLWTRILKSKYIRLFNDGFITQGGTNIACRKLEGDAILSVRHSQMMSDYEIGFFGLVPTATAVMYNWIICPYGITTGETSTRLKLVEQPVIGALDENAWTFEYTKALKLWDDNPQLTGIAVNISTKG